MSDSASRRVFTRDFDLSFAVLSSPPQHTLLARSMLPTFVRSLGFTPTDSDIVNDIVPKLPATDSFDKSILFSALWPIKQRGEYSPDSVQTILQALQTIVDTT